MRYFIQDTQLSPMGHGRQWHIHYTGGKVPSTELFAPLWNIRLWKEKYLGLETQVRRHSRSLKISRTTSFLFMFSS